MMTRCCPSLVGNLKKPNETSFPAHSALSGCHRRCCVCPSILQVCGMRLWLSDFDIFLQMSSFAAFSGWQPHPAAVILLQCNHRWTNVNIFQILYSAVSLHPQGRKREHPLMSDRRQTLWVGEAKALDRVGVRVPAQSHSKGR